MEFKGTKGVWEASLNTIGTEIMCGENHICLLSSTDTEANAKLIASAPELLALAIETFNLCDKMQFPTEQELKELKIKAKQLITKSTT